MKKTLAAITTLVAVLAASAAWGDTDTSRFKLTKPAIGSSGWGIKTNNNWDLVDSTCAGLGQANTFTQDNTFNKTLLPPRYTTTTRDALTNVSTGTVIYNTTTGQHETFKNGGWTSIGGSTSGFATLGGTQTFTGENTFASGNFYLSVPGYPTSIFSTTSMGFRTPNGVKWYGSGDELLGYINSNQSVNSSLRIHPTQAGGLEIYDSADAAVIMHVGNIGRENVVIGTSAVSTAYTLDVDGDIRIRGANDLRFGGSSNTAADHAANLRWDGGTGLITDGPLTAGATITATTYLGDGSHLTGISAGVTAGDTTTWTGTNDFTHRVIVSSCMAVGSSATSLARLFVDGGGIPGEGNLGIRKPGELRYFDSDDFPMGYIKVNSNFGLELHPNGIDGTSFYNDADNAIVMRVGNTDSDGGQVVSYKNIVLANAGNGLKIKEGANATMGQSAVLVTTGTIVYTNKVTSSSRIFLQPDDGATNVGTVYILSRNSGVSFTVQSTNAADARKVNWLLIEPSDL